MGSQNKPKFKNIKNKSFIVNDNNKPSLIWDSRSVAVNIIVLILLNDLFEPYVLISKRGPKAADFEGLMNVVAGYLDKNEDGPNAAIREVWEETGLNINKLIVENQVFTSDLLQPWYVNTDPSENKQNVSLRYGIVFYANKIPELSTKYNEVKGEVEDPQWIPISKIDNYEWAFNHDKVIKDYIKYVGVWNKYL